MIIRTLFSKRTLWETRPNALSKALADKKRTGEKILDLTESNPTRCGFHFLTPERLSPLSSPENAVYGPDPQGLLSAREAVARYYAEKGVSVRPERIFLTASTSEAYSHLFKLLCDPGETAASPVPSYPLFGFLSGLSDVTLSPYSLDLKRGMEDLRAGTPKAVISVNPNNPTGHFTGKEDRALLNDFCKNAGAALIADEVFLDYRLTTEGPAPLSFASNEEVLTFTLSGISKILGLPQMKLSWIVLSGPEEEARQAAEKLEVILDTFLSVNAPVQRALPVWLSKKEEVIGLIRQRLLSNLACLRSLAASQTRWELLSPEGGWYAVLKDSAGASDEETALRLLREKNIWVHPGYFYDFPSEGFLALSLLPDPALFKEAAERIFE
ncbi:MAG TPA: pyridoxal phosphate-dependent aminotransferase [Candidatus Omnitrophota bacterium]|nr:pyridoxal phosphate-dependent aminotransferase [Candidatus Omnitrophota bacterium]